MKNLFPLFLLFGLLASSFVSAEDRTSDPNDINVPIVGTDDNWQLNLASQDRLTNEDFNIALKIEQTDQDDDDDEDFDDFNDSDDDNDDDVPLAGANLGSARKEGFEKTADGDFDLILIRKEILRKARDDQDIDDIDYTNDNDDSDETPEVEPVDFDLRPDNGRISTQVISTDDEKNEIEDSDDGDDGDDADIVDDQDDSHGDDVDDDYQQDNDSAMADDDYVNDPDAVKDNLYDDMDYDNDDDSDDGDEKDDTTDKDDFQDYVKNSPFNSVNLQRMKLNITTIDIRPQDSDDTDDNLDDVLFDADDSDDEDSDFYDIYDTKYREELERGGLGPDEAIASYDYDIFIDIDDSAWASILTEERKQ